jgi:5-azacytidine-induced protein 1
LSEKCEKLVKELKDVEKTYTDRLRTAEERFKVDSQKIKDTIEMAEKIRREKWIEEKTKQIKEMTVKGLEPEIQSLITKHKNEIKKLKTIHDAELLQADERAAQRYIKITEELRENYEREKEASIQREKDLSKQRYEKSLEEEEKSFLEQRRRLYAEVEEEKNRIAEQAAFQRKELDKLRKILEENNFNAIETIKKEYNESQVELEKKHQTEIKNLKEKLEIEKQSWEQNYLKKQVSKLSLSIYV